MKQTDYFTHYNPRMEYPWVALHIPSARFLLSGYSDADFSSFGDLMGGYCRLIDDAELIGEGMIEEEAIKNARIIK